jgi:hypothetical protein
MGWGSSGGSYQQHQTADNYPGLLDSLMTGSSFPDVGFATIYPAADAWLLHIFFMRDNKLEWTPAQQRAVSGFGSLASIQEMTDRAQRINPVANWNADVAKGLRYDWTENPKGARATVYDHTRNVYGTDPSINSSNSTRRSAALISMRSTSPNAWPRIPRRCGWLMQRDACSAVPADSARCRSSTTAHTSIWIPPEMFTSDITRSPRANV